MKRFLHYTTALGVLFALSTPLAFADTTHDKTHAATDKTHVADDKDAHDKTSHDKTAEPSAAMDASKMHDDTSHGADANRSPAQHSSPWTQNGNFLPGHTPGDNRLPIYTQQGAQHPQ